MSFKDFFSMKNLADDIGFIAKYLKISEIKTYKVVQGEPSKALLLGKKFRKYFFKKTYKCRPKIKENKLRDLTSLVESDRIPHFYDTFYRNLSM